MQTGYEQEDQRIGEVKEKEEREEEKKKKKVDCSCYSNRSRKKLRVSLWWFLFSPQPLAGLKSKVQTFVVPLPREVENQYCS